MNAAEFQAYVKEFSTAKGFESTLEQRMLYLMTEVGELAQEMLAVSYHPEAEKKENIGYEMFDVVWNIFDLANKLDIDLQQAFRAKMEINTGRTWS